MYIEALILLSMRISVMTVSGAIFLPMRGLMVAVLALPGLVSSYRRAEVDPHLGLLIQINSFDRRSPIHNSTRKLSPQVEV